MADFACLFEEADGTFCMEAVAVAGQRCAHHTRVVEVPVMVVPPAVVIARPELPDEQRCIAIMKNGQRCYAHRKPRSTRCGTHKDWTPLVQCSATKRDGQRCTVHALPGRTMCGLHKAQEPAVAPAAPAPAPVAPAVPCCHVIISSRSSVNYGKECGLTRRLVEIPAGPGAQPEFCCTTHVSKRKQNLRGIWRAVDLQSVRTVYAEAGNPDRDPEINEVIIHSIYRTMEWQVPMTIYSTTDTALARQESMRRAREGMRLWEAEILRREARLNPPAPRSDLERFTRDAQNVHTAHANKLVADANAELEKAEAISGSLKHIKQRFEERKFGTPEKRKQVYTDMKRWYSDAKVMRAVGQMEDNDYGYKRLLDKVWGLIQKSKHKDDLEQRLWEEAYDSLGMCTQGHLTRLANVLQGFDESAEAPKVEIPKGERLQTAMAQIAELPQNERESAARRVFAELEVADGEQGAWLEALEVA